MTYYLRPMNFYRDFDLTLTLAAADHEHAKRKAEHHLALLAIVGGYYGKVKGNLCCDDGHIAIIKVKLGLGDLGRSFIHVNDDDV